ncbi:MAG: DUF1801 domain-containing protein [Gemmatimonadetes bacterium]|nr:DUF1801 domain-containing protein [Gemmatimonadota bacterium]
MAELKTKPARASVKAFLDAIPDDQQRKDCRVIARMMRDATSAQPKMWGSDIVGYGSYHYKYANGREADWFLAGFSPRKQALTLYIMAGFHNYGTLLKKLGKHKTGTSCLYIKRLDDVNASVLEKLITASTKHMAKQAKAR